MRQVASSLIVAAMMSVAGCGGPPSDQGNENAGGPTEEYFTVRAGPIANARIDAIDGTFQMVKVGAANGIPSAGRGGACIVFDPADLGFSEMAGEQCTNNASCDTDETNGFAYCDTQTAKCWVKLEGAPGEALCNRPITMTATTINHVPKQPTPASDPKVKPGTKARVVACLNKAGANPTQTGCGSVDGADRIEVMGPVATLR